jgi:hypothetical protein
MQVILTGYYNSKKKVPSINELRACKEDCNLALKLGAISFTCHEASFSKRITMDKEFYSR